MKYILFLIVLSGSYAKGESLNDTIFLDAKLNKCVRDTFTYFRLTEKQNDVLLVKDYYKSGILKSEGIYSSLDPEVMNGKFTYYFESGYKKATGEYYNNKKRGLYNSYADTTGLLLSSITFDNGKMNGPMMIRGGNGDITNGTYQNNVLIKSAITAAPTQKDYLKIEKKIIPGIGVVDDHSNYFSEMLKADLQVSIPDSVKKRVSITNVTYGSDTDGKLLDMSMVSGGDKLVGDLIIKSIRKTWREIPKDRVLINKKFLVTVVLPDVKVSVGVADTNSWVRVNRGVRPGEFEVKYKDAETIGSKALNDYFKQKYSQTNFPNDTSIKNVVVVKFDVGPGGKVRNIQLLAGSDSRLNDFVIDQVKQYKSWVPKSLKLNASKYIYKLSVKFPDIVVATSMEVEIY